MFIIIDTSFIESENDIYAVKATNIDEALILYSKNHYSEDDFFLSNLINKTLDIRGWNEYISSIYDSKSNQFKTDVSEDEIDIQLNKIIKLYLGDDGQRFKSEFTNYYMHNEIDAEELSSELIYFIALREIQFRKEEFIIKQIDYY